jgi:hypothetical protein
MAAVDGVPAIACPLCARNAAEHRMSCATCCIRLMRSAPPGPLRESMAEHVRTTAPAATQDAIRALLAKTPAAPQTQRDPA